MSVMRWGMSFLAGAALSAGVTTVITQTPTGGNYAPDAVQYTLTDTTKEPVIRYKAPDGEVVGMADVSHPANMASDSTLFRKANGDTVPKGSITMDTVPESQVPPPLMKLNIRNGKPFVCYPEHQYKLQMWEKPSGGNAQIIMEIVVNLRKQNYPHEYKQVWQMVPKLQIRPDMISDTAIANKCMRLQNYTQYFDTLGTRYRTYCTSKTKWINQRTDTTLVTVWRNGAYTTRYNQTPWIQDTVPTCNGN